ncbi:hypothetical protein H6P81_018368 [Aristolochia fimbriata]|uniref:Uncharacterized protein n=1 Tax=Aristolochia fimbriata TaxID=158543 RepID=A0AAV7E210_ARIFI|nr:hypothetical protein H6P81_018368 [Aristolochia fimbriata]
MFPLDQALDSRTLFSCKAAAGFCFSNLLDWTSWLNCLLWKVGLLEGPLISALSAEAAGVGERRDTQFNVCPNPRTGKRGVRNQKWKDSLETVDSVINAQQTK